MRVPAEIILLLAEHLAQLNRTASLARLSLASIRIYGLVTPVLYRSLSIHTQDAARAVHAALSSNNHLAAHVRRVFLAWRACPFFIDSRPGVFGSCAHMVAAEFQTTNPSAAAVLMDRLSAAPNLRVLAVSHLHHDPLHMLTVLPRHTIAPRLEDFHVSSTQMTSGANVLQDCSALQRLRTFSCAYAVDASRPPDVVDRALVAALLQPCEALASLPSLQRLCVVLHPPAAAQRVLDGQFCTALRARERRGLCIVLAAVEESDLRAIVEREAGWWDTLMRR